LAAPRMAWTFSVRAATRADAGRIVALVNAAFSVERFFVSRDRTTLDEIRGFLEKGTFLVADGDGDALAACVYVEPRGDRMYLGMLSVDPALQGRGLGRRMMAVAEAHALAAGCPVVDIRIVNIREELPPFYRSQGFVETGATDPVDDPFATR